MKKVLILLSLGILLAGCAQVPMVVQRPWNRTLSNDAIPAGASISVNVKSVGSVLLGSDMMTEERIEDSAKALLERRGFIVTDNKPQYSLWINIKSESKTKVSTGIKSYSTSGLITSKYYGLGVFLAQALQMNMATNATTTQVAQTETEYFLHTFGSEISNADNQIIWKNDTYIETLNVNILDVYTPLLQVAFSSLPTTGDVVPRVKKLKEGRFDDYMESFVGDRSTMCPALPHLIKFDMQFFESDGSYKGTFGVENPEALLAYLDLLETAEYAIPNSSVKLWSDPTDISLWKKVLIFGKYYLGNDEKPINILIHLKGTASNYVVEWCGLVDDNHYADLEQLQSKWIKTLQNYYDFYDE